MDRRSFLQASGIAAATGLPALAAPAAPAAMPHSARLSVPLVAAWTPGHPVLGPLAATLAARIAEVTAGRLQLTPADGPGAIAPVARLTHADADDLADPAAALFGPLPCGEGLRPHDLVDWLTAGGGQALWDAVGARHGVKPLLIAHSGARPGLWMRQRLGADGRLDGLRIVASPAIGRHLEALGATVVTPRDDIAAVLGDDRIDGIEAGSLAEAVAAGISGWARVQYPDALRPQGRAVALWLPLPAWDGLDPGARRGVEAVAAASLSASLAEHRAHEGLLRRFVAETQGIASLPTPPALADALSRSVSRATEQAALSDPLTGRIAASIRAYRANAFDPTPYRPLA